MDPYIPYFEKKYLLSRKDYSFKEHIKLLIEDRFFAVHILKPILEFDCSSFFTIWDYGTLQIKWAKEKGWNETNLKKILFAQIEEFKPDVFYTNNPNVFESSEIRNLGGRDMIKIAWFASPEVNKVDFSIFHSRLTNLPLDIRDKSETGYRTDYFFPSYDPAMESFAKCTERPTDIFFYGQYVNKHFDSRNELVQKLIKLKQQKNWNIKISLQYHPVYKKLRPNNAITRRLAYYLNILEFPPGLIRKNCDIISSI